MVAKKSKGWRSGKREGRSRMVQMTRHLVVSEGKETEPRYFEGVRAALGAANERKVAIIVKGTGKHTHLTYLTLPSNTAAMRPRHSTMCGSCMTRMTFLRPTLTRWSANATSSPMVRGPSMRCGRTPASSCGLFCTFATRPRICPRPTASMPSRRRCRETWASSTARTWTGCSRWWTANEARHCSVLGASSHTIGGWVTLSHLRKTLQLRWAKFSM